MTAKGGLTIQRMVELGVVSRAGFYRFDEEARPGADPDMDLRDAIQRIALEWPAYGRPRVTAELRRQGWVVNPKRVYRLMREDNLLCVRKRKFLVTTNSKHGRRTYPNLVPDLVLTGVDQLWVADITYIRLREEFIYLAVVLDAYSRRVIGWALDRHIEDELTLAALRMALASRTVGPGLVHHSDRGSQYASDDYTDLLKNHGIDMSMSRKGNPWDGAGRCRAHSQLPRVRPYAQHPAGNGGNRFSGGAAAPAPALADRGCASRVPLGPRVPSSHVAGAAGPYARRPRPLWDLTSPPSPRLCSSR